jgi:hypothetical protein
MSETEDKLAIFCKHCKRRIHHDDYSGSGFRHEEDWSISCSGTLAEPELTEQRERRAKINPPRVVQAVPIPPEEAASSRLAAQLECYAISQVSTAAEHIDWMQVQLNHSARNGPPCFYVESHPFGERFCLRAQQWQGHKKGEVHEFTSLAEMLKSATSSRVAGITAILKKACDRDWKDETPEQVAQIAANAIYWRGEKTKI